MKKSKLIISLLILLGIAFLNGSISAQTKEDMHLRMTNYHKSIILHARAIISGEAKTKEKQLEHLRKASTDLVNVQRTHREMKKLIPKKTRKEIKPVHKNIDSMYESSKTHINWLTKELTKIEPDYAKVKEHAKSLEDAIDKAEQEHLKLIEKPNL